MFHFSKFYVDCTSRRFQTTRPLRKLPAAPENEQSVRPVAFRRCEEAGNAASRAKRYRPIVALIACLQEPQVSRTVVVSRTTFGFLLQLFSLTSSSQNANRTPVAILPVSPPPTGFLSAHGCSSHTPPRGWCLCSNSRLLIAVC